MAATKKQKIRGLLFATDHEDATDLYPWVRNEMWYCVELDGGRGRVHIHYWREGSSRYSDVRDREGCGKPEPCDGSCHRKLDPLPYKAAKKVLAYKTNR